MVYSIYMFQIGKVLNLVITLKKLFGNTHLQILVKIEAAALRIPTNTVRYFFGTYSISPHCGNDDDVTPMLVTYRRYDSVCWSRGQRSRQRVTDTEEALV